MQKFVRDDIRNIAIIAHVDHGKTTLVDAMLKQSGIFRANQQVEERIMDSNELERERGITILSKNTAVKYKDVNINIVDTPGHADFGGEVERVLNMVNGVLLLVDAFEGPMPQTRFVLRKALNLKLKPVVVINKIDRPDARVEEVVDEVLDLFIELGADDNQLDFPVIYASAKDGTAKADMNDDAKDLKPLFEAIVDNIPSPEGYVDQPLQILVSTIEHDDYIGRICVGRIIRGVVKDGQNVVICKKDGSIQAGKIVNLYIFSGLKRKDVSEARLGDIVAISGFDNINIGETIADPDLPEAIPFVDIDEPTVSMTFSASTSPFIGKEGTYVTSRHLRDRLMKEVKTNVSMRIEETDSPDSFVVAGRGELHLSILIETMRREGFEFQVSRPTVIMKVIDGKKCEPMEDLLIEVPEEYVGTVIEKLGTRKAEMLNMSPMSDGRSKLEFKIPSRGLIGYRSDFMTDTKGNGIMNHVFMGYEEYKGEIAERSRGSLIAFETGEATIYGLFNAQERGTLFIGPNTQIYEGMVIGESLREQDIDVNVCKKKHLTNMRSSAADEALRLTTPRSLSLEEALDFIGSDELVEVTPKSIRIRKKILNSQERYKVAGRQK